MTILFGLIAWSLTHIVDRLLQSPIIELASRTEIIKLASRTEPGLRRVHYEISNISRDKIFQDLEFRFELDVREPAKFKKENCKIILYPPADLHEPAEPEDNSFKVIIGEFHPNWKIGVRLEIIGNENPLPVFSSGVGGKAAQAVMLVPASYETFLIKNEITIILWLVAFWGTLIIIYLVASLRSENAKA